MEDKIFRNQQQGRTIPNPPDCSRVEKIASGGGGNAQGGIMGRPVGREAGWSAVIGALGFRVLDIEKGRG